MEDEKNTPDQTDPAAAVDTAPEGEADVQEAGQETNPEQQEVESLTKEEIEVITKRKYESKSDALKHLQELNRYVGDQSIAELRKKAEQLDKLQKDDEISDEKPQTDDVKSKVEELSRELSWERFIKKNPVADKYREVFKTGADASGQDYEEYYLTSGLKEIIEKSHSEPKGSTTVKSNTRVGSSSPDFNKLAKQALDDPSTETTDALVAEQLRRLGEKV